ncbi:hypothetical protein ACN38_g4984 [Penicillium nordicum]|uniref:Uncharacterized protein n=1 Tax=Penicillium nordicum TaxID=229535 RepID=A0A0M8P5T3_9EURO|nr:hypothetical protein ACN38_g4984 [Penicillium nordicum]
MPLDNVTSGVTGQLPPDKVQSTTSGVVKKSAPKKQNRTTKDLTDPFPSDDAPPKDEDIDNNLSLSSIWSTITTWFSTLFPQAFDYLKSCVQRLVVWLLPPPRQAAIYETALKHPAASTLIVCQMICCGVPLLAFSAGVFIFAAVSILFWTVLSLLILGPVLLGTSMMGMFLWGWGWIFYGLVKWVDQRFLGGIIAHVWLRRTQSESTGGEGQSEEEKKDE